MTISETKPAVTMTDPLTVMMDALERVHRDELTGYEAGEILVAAGWACFPIPAGYKFANGFSYEDATRDPSEWRTLVAELTQQPRNRTMLDVNIGVCPFKCAVPMVVIDHDSATGLFEFSNEWYDKTAGSEQTLRIASPSGNEHHWFLCDEPLANGYHAWGGETRGANGHVLLPPSWADGGSYQAVNFHRPLRIDDHPWVLREGRTRADDRERVKVSSVDVDVAMGKLSVREFTPGGHELLDKIIQQMKHHERGGRNPAMAAAVNALLDASVSGLIPADVGLDALREEYVRMVAGDRDRDAALGEIYRMTKVWLSRHPFLESEIAASDWARNEGSVPVSPVQALETAEAVTQAPEKQAQGESPKLSDETERQISREMAVLAIRQEAMRRVRIMQDSGSWMIPDSRFSLREELEVEDPPIQWEIEGLHEVGTNVLLTAAFKTGKTTLALNLMKARMDATSFLGAFPAAERPGKVAWWNFELTESQARRWLRDMKVTHPENGSVLHFRGHKLPIHSDYVRDTLVAWLKERDVKYLIVDPYGSAYGGKENDNDEVREWTRRLDEIKILSGVESVVLVTHTGRGGQEKGFEHARGAAKLDDWADIRWVYTRDKDDDENSNRYFYAHGRDVDFEETAVEYDEATRELRINKGAAPRGERGPSNKTIQSVLDAVVASPGSNRADIIRTVGGNNKRAEDAFKRCIANGYINFVKGSKPNEKLWSVTPAYEWALKAGTDMTTASPESSM